MRQLFVACISMALLTACASRNIDGTRYSDAEPNFQLEEFFNGPVKAWGIVQDRSGNMTQQFEVDIDGQLKDGLLTLDETFTYLAGEGVSKRIWSIRRNDGGGWSGTAGDILDSAAGTEFGKAFQWRYQMDLPVDDTSYRVTFDDWIWAFDSDTIINRSYITKFGITFAEVTIFMQRQRG